MNRTRVKTTFIVSLAALCLALFIRVQPAGAATTPLSIELGEAQEYGLKLNNFWDLQRNISVDRSSDEIFRFYGYNHPSLTYREGEGGGFMDVGQLAKPAGGEVLQITPALLAYNGKQYIETGHLYILKTLTLGYFALYVDDIPLVNDERYMNFTLYKLKGAPSKAASAPPAPAVPSTPSLPVTPSVLTTLPASSQTQAAPAAPQQWPGGDNKSGKTEELTKITFNQKPIVVNDRTFVPLRDLFEALGAEVKWDGSTQTVLATKGQNKVSLQIDNKVAWFNGQPRQLEAAPFISGEKTYVPLRFASEALGEKVSYDSATGKVVFGKYYFYLDEGNNSNTTDRTEAASDQKNVTEDNGSDSGDLTEKDIDRYWNERLRYDVLQRSLFGR